jgi:hypothetical protein
MSSVVASQARAGRLVDVPSAEVEYAVEALAADRTDGQLGLIDTDHRTWFAGPSALSLLPRATLLAHV